MPIQPRPMAETARPLRPSLRVFIMATPEGKLESHTLNRCEPLAEDSPARVGRRLLPLTWPLARKYFNSSTIKKQHNQEIKVEHKSVLPTCPPSRLAAGPWRGLTETLSRIAHNHSHDAAREHDFKIVVLARRVRHGRDRVRQQQADAQPEEQAQGQRIHLLRKISDENSRDQSFHRGPDHDG